MEGFNSWSHERIGMEFTFKTKLAFDIFDDMLLIYQVRGEYISQLRFRSVFHLEQDYGFHDKLHHPRSQGMPYSSQHVLSEVILFQLNNTK